MEEDRFADIFEMAYREESLSVAGSLAPGSSIASSSIHMLSLGSSSLGSMKSSSCRLGAFISACACTHHNFISCRLPL